MNALLHVMDQSKAVSNCSAKFVPAKYNKNKPRNRVHIVLQVQLELRKKKIRKMASIKYRE